MPIARDDGIELGRRAFERFAVAVDAEVKTDAGSVAAVTRDLSRGGVCFVLPTPLERGSSFRISLSLVLGQNTFSEALELSGFVVWCTETAEGYQIGASFGGLDAESQEYLQMFLGFLAEGVQVGEEGEGPGGDEDDEDEKGLFG